ncbi:MAG: glycosyltransferase [Bacteroidaceae bacterium]|nr:glycosyltransferase [Bacteroidaceae bacterium]
MKVLIVNASERIGGAAIAARRLAIALRKQGHDVTMLVGDKQGEEPWVVQAAPLWQLKLNKTVERGRIFALNRFSKEGLWDIDIAGDGVDITPLQVFKEADVVHLHWVNQGFLSGKSILKIMQSGKRIVWTMHDMWPFTGICHHAGECRRHRKECGECPLLRLPKADDMSRQLVEQKREWYGETARLSFVACSHWLEELAQQSSLLRDRHVTCIPNPIDTHTFCPGDKIEARKKLGLPLKTHLVLFASMKVTDERKGVNYLLETARLLKKKYKQDDSNLAFVAMGQHAERLQERIQFPVYSLGYVSDMQQIATVYRAVDLFVTPSLYENLPNTIVEAMACGTPCVGFRTGGIPEMIDHLANGYVANYKDSDDLAQGILHTLSHPGMGDAAEHYAQYMYDEARVARQYAEIYRLMPEN